MTRSIVTEAWVIHRGPKTRKTDHPEPAELRREEITLPDLEPYEVLARPIYGCWEGNMAHAVERKPIDICRLRGEERVVLGNAGVIEVERTGAAVRSVSEGDLCLVFGNGVWDEYGYTLKVYAYDAPGTVGLLAKKTKLHEMNCIRIPPGTKHSLRKWAAFSVRFITAWSNWEMAYGCWRLQMTAEDLPRPYVWGWGGGTALAEVALAKLCGCEAALISSDERRLSLIRAQGIDPIDRKGFLDLWYDEERFAGDVDYRRAYAKSEEAFLETVRRMTAGHGVSIFVDNIGTPVLRATLKALGRQGVITTAGWKSGMSVSFVRAVECISRHIHVHTHYARYPQGLAAVAFAEESGWLPPVDEEVAGWDDIPSLAKAYSENGLGYFPIFQVNPP